MPNTLTYSVGLDSAGFSKGIREMEMIAGISGKRIGGALEGGFMSHGGPGGGISGAIRESLVLVRELGRGNYTRMPGSVILLSQYLGGLNLLIKNSASEAIKAAAAEDKLAKQLALVAIAAREKAMASEAAMFADGADAEATLAVAAADDIAATAAEKAASAQDAKAASSWRAAKIAMMSAVTGLNWITVAVIGAIAVFAGLAFAAVHYANVMERRFKNLSDMLDPFKKSFQDEVKQVEKAVEVEREYARWQDEINSNRREELALFDRKLAAMKEEAAAQREIMRLRGESASAIAQFDKQQLLMEKDLLTAEQERIAKEQGEAQLVTQVAKTAYEKGAVGRGGMTMSGAEAAMKSAADIAEAARTAMTSAKIVTDPGHYAGAGMSTLGSSPRAANESDVLTFKVGGNDVTISLRQANAALNEATADWKLLKVAEDNLKRVYDNAMSTEEDKAKASQKLADAQAKVAEEIKIQDKYGSVRAGLEDAKKGGIGRTSSADALVRVGNFIGSSKGGIEKLAEEHNRLARVANGHLSSIDNKLGGNNQPGAGNYDRH